MTSTTGVSFSKAANALGTGAALMAALALPVNAFNTFSVLCCYKNYSMIKAIREAYEGTSYNRPPSVSNLFTRGIVQHFQKELARLVVKTGGLFSLKPWLEQRYRNDPYGAWKTAIGFAIPLAAWEAGIQPFDTWCTESQSGKSFLSVRAAYVGAMANFLRQFFTWGIFSYSEAYCDRLLRQKTSIDPHSVWGVLAKSLFVGFTVTGVCHPTQRLKNQLQCFPEIVAQATAQKTSRYADAYRHILATQGWRGFPRGALPKGLGNSGLALGALALLYYGRGAVAKNKT